LVYSAPGDTNKIFDLSFNLEGGKYNFVTVGSKHIKFWDPVSKTSEKGIFGDKGEMTSFACCAWDNSGVCYAGGSNAMVYIWKGRNLDKTVKVHDSGFISAMRFYGGYLFTGGKDGNVCVLDVNNGLNNVKKI
jgi:WD40 repeat protein